MDVVGVPVQVSDASIVLPSVQHDEVDQVSYGEGSPYAKLRNVSIILETVARSPILSHPYQLGESAAIPSKHAQHSSSVDLRQLHRP